MKLTIVGAGSTYTPGLVLRWINTKRDRIALTEICLHDVNQERLEVLYRFIDGMITKEAPEVRLSYTNDLAEAVTGSAFVVLQIRVGLNHQRREDEHICIDHGFIGQETTGPAGWALSMRQIPACLEVAKMVHELAPDAWLISVANPAGIVGEALIKYGHDKTISMCHGGFYPRAKYAAALGINEDRLLFDYIGLNHLGWTSKAYVDGEQLSDEQMRDLAANLYEAWGKAEISIPPSFAYDFCPIIANSHYISDYYMQDELVADMQRTQITRADEVLKIEDECLDYYINEAGKEVVPPAVLATRGGKIERKREGVYGAIGYSDGCLAIIDALLHAEPQWIIVNALNEGSISDLPDDACVEMPAYVNCTGVTRINMGPLPIAIRGQIQSVKAYETMTVEAAVSGDRRVALAALLNNPICQGKYVQTKALMDALLEASRQYLPQFFKG